MGERKKIKRNKNNREIFVMKIYNTRNTYEEVGQNFVYLIFVNGSGIAYLPYHL